MSEFQKSEIERLTRERANERARGIHSCHDKCDRDGCVNWRLRAELAALRAEFEQYKVDLHEGEQP